MMQILCKELTVGYEDGAVVKNINFRVSKGDYLCILGNNGSGKTTLMKTLLGLIEPLSGEITFDKGLAGHIGYLPQKTQVQKDFPASVEEIVLSGCLSKCGNRPFYGKEEKKLAADNMKKLGIEKLARKSFRNLSGGQQQRVLLARTLCAAEKLLLLDEPSAGLDPLAITEMYDSVKRLNEEGMTIIMVSHDLEAAEKYADHILDLGNNKVFFGTKDEYVSMKRGMTDE